MGDRPLDHLTREDALAFRAWWDERCREEGHKRATANKDFTHLSGMISTVSDLKRWGLDNAFRGLSFRQDAAEARRPFSPAWIAERLLAPGALDGLGAEARDIFLVMVNTGARNSEVIGARPQDFAVDHAVPHLAIASHPGRTLKTDHSARRVPLVGVSLDAARRLARTGCPRYGPQPDRWSAAVNKYLGQHGLVTATLFCWSRRSYTGNSSSCRMRRASSSSPRA